MRDDTLVPGGTPTVPPRDSATVMVARDAPGGVELFMLERHLSSDFFGGAYVFPGGKIDDADTDPTLNEFVDPPAGAPSLDPGAIGASVEAPPGKELGFHLAAIRETFEEAGVLLARHEDGSVVRLDGAEAGRFAEARRALNAREATLLDIARSHRIRYALDLMFYFSRWITPEAVPKRYDTRFFVARLPEGQTPLHDDFETTSGLWIRPQDALDRAIEGGFTIIFPTRKTLESIAVFETVDDLIASTEGKQIGGVLPALVTHEGELKVRLPDGTYHAP
ncbi:MAG: hypothetical protein ABR548_00095 [Actinomycetota bacterium]|nr:hypothetical protein [Actinomycetota bacterium]